MPTPNRHYASQGETIQEEMAIRTRTFSYRVANAGIVGIEAAYAGDPYVSRYFDILRPISGRYLTLPLADIRPNMICMRFETFNVVIICGITLPGHGLALAEGGALAKPIFGIPGQVFGAIWEITDACISYIQSCFTSIDANSRWLVFGYSMGGVLSHQCVARLIKQFHVPAENIIGVYTFGNPKSGDPVFADWLSQQIPCHVIRALGDPVSSLPLEGTQYLWNVLDAVTSPFVEKQTPLSFDYKHCQPVWLLNPDGTLEATDTASSTLQIIRSHFQSIMQSVTGGDSDALARHKPANFQNSLNAAKGDWGNSQALINLGGSIQENVPSTTTAPAAPPYPSNPSNPDG